MKLFLIPCNLSDDNITKSIPSYVLEDIIPNLSFFMVENLRTARRFIKKVKPDTVIDDLTFCEIGKNSDFTESSKFFHKNIATNDIGILSEAGCPGVADPGSHIVALAHTTKDVQVVPLVGPSSILLALMASGLNGQNFSFHGYIPMQNNLRNQKIKQMEANARKWKQSQIFIETPFRNNQMFEALLSHCNNDTLLCIASELTSSNEYIATKSIGEWKKHTINLHKKPTVFLFL